MEFWDHGVSTFEFWWKPSSRLWLPTDFSPCPHTAEKDHANSYPILKRALTPWVSLHHYDLITVQRSHLQIPSHWELDFNIWIWGGDTVIQSMTTEKKAFCKSVSTLMNLLTYFFLTFSFQLFRMHTCSEDKLWASDQVTWLSAFPLHATDVRTRADVKLFWHTLLSSD